VANAQVHRILINAVESYIRTVAEDTRDIKAAIRQNEQLMQTIDTGIKQSSDLTKRFHDEHTQSVVRLESSILNLHVDIESQEVEGRLREQRKYLSFVVPDGNANEWTREASITSS
jgi:hypothetical protein